jgi:hypothetical protein
MEPWCGRRVADSTTLVQQLLTSLQARPYRTVLPQGLFVCSEQFVRFVPVGPGRQYGFNAVNDPLPTGDTLRYALEPFCQPLLIRTQSSA